MNKLFIMINAKIIRIMKEKKILRYRVEFEVNFDLNCSIRVKISRLLCYSNGENNLKEGTMVKKINYP